MNQDFRSLRLSGLSRISNWLVLLGIIWLLGSVGLGWLVKSVFILMGLLIVTPVIAFWGLRWWLSRNLVEASCPVCSTPLVGINGQQTRCPNCQEVLQASEGEFFRPTPPGTVDVEVVDVSVKEITD
ncbi:MAG: hypothetical protein AAF289_06165 [Cyanobacteria bacterium P01_A01_bin.135]